MNKWQIICPLAAMALVVLALGLLHTRSHSRDAVLATAFSVGTDLATKTNSDCLTSMSPALKSNLVGFLAAPARSDGVRAEAPDHGEPTATVSLVNDAGKRFDISLRWEANLRKFTPMSFTYPAPWPPTNWPAPTQR